MPAVREHQYGACAVTDEPLVAFSTVAVRSYRYYNSDPWFEVKWCRTRTEAETLRAAAVEKLAALRKEMAERELLKEAREKAEAAKERVKDVYGEYRSVGKNRDTESALYTRAYAYLPDGLEDLRKWVIETNELAEKAMAEIAAATEAARKREEEIAPLVERVGDRAEFVHVFVEELVKSVGSEKAHRRLSAEFNAPYGRARRQDALASICTGENGQRFLAFHQARVVDDVLEGAIFWLEHKFGLQPVVRGNSAPSQNQPESQSGSSGLGSLGDAFAKLGL